MTNVVDDNLVRTRVIEKLKKRFIQLLNDTEILDAKKTEELYKIQLIIDRMQKGCDIRGITIEVMDMFTKYINRVETNKDFINKLAEHIHNFFDYVQYAC